MEGFVGRALEGLVVDGVAVVETGDRRAGTGGGEGDFIGGIGTEIAVFIEDFDFYKGEVLAIAINPAAVRVSLSEAGLPAVRISSVATVTCR